MSHRWLLFLLCLSVLPLSLVQLTRAGGELRVNEARTKVLFQKEPAEVLLAVENSTGQNLNARVAIELLNPTDRVTAQIDQIQSIGTGSQLLKLVLPLSLAKFQQQDRRELLWYRLRYRISEQASPGNTLTQGILSLSEITPDLFELRVVTGEVVRESRSYHARVQAIHPITRRPIVNVRIDGEITLDDDEDDNDKSVKLSTGRTTDANGYALLEVCIAATFSSVSTSAPGW